MLDHSRAELVRGGPSVIEGIRGGAALCPRRGQDCAGASRSGTGVSAWLCLKVNAALCVMPRWQAFGAIREKIGANRPDRLLWGADWPHPAAQWIPNDGDFADLLLD